MWCGLVLVKTLFSGSKLQSKSGQTVVLLSLNFELWLSFNPIVSQIQSSNQFLFNTSLVHLFFLHNFRFDNFQVSI